MGREEERARYVKYRDEHNPPKTIKNRSISMSDSDWERIGRIADYYGSSRADTLRTMARYFEVHLKLGGLSPASPVTRHGGERKGKDANTDGSGDSG